MPKLFLLMGGFIQEKDDFSKTFDGILIHINKIRESVIGGSTPNYGDDLVMQVMQKTTFYHLEKGNNVILNSQLFSKKSRAAFLKIAKKLNIEVELYWFDMSMSFLKEKGNLKDEDIISISKLFDIPMLEEGITKIHRFSDKDFL